MAALPAIGGSHAQRDVFVRTLALIAADDGDAAALETILAARGRLKKEDSLVRLTQERLMANGRGRRMRSVA